jgi:hypothetical protein
VLACNDWLRLGPGRSLPELLTAYTKIHQNTPPTESVDTLKSWAARYGWAERAAAYDNNLEARKDERRAKVMEAGIALDYERVVKLKRLAAFLEGQIYEQGEEGKYHNVWLPDVKQVGSGLTAERVDLERFNAPLIGEFRATLDDIAKEVGGRKVKQEITGADGGPLFVVVLPPNGRESQ